MGSAGDRNFYPLWVLGSLVEVTQLSNCNLIKVGAVLLRNKEVVAYGHNAWRKDECLNCPKYKSSLLSPKPYKLPKCTSLHAEEIVLKYSQPGDDLLISHSPCLNCAKLIVKHGIRQVAFLQQYKHTEGLDWLLENNVPFTQVGE